MAYMQFPGTNYNDLNLDWILKQVKQLTARVESLEERVDALEGEDEEDGSDAVSGNELP